MNLPTRVSIIPLLVFLSLPVAAQTYRWIDPATGRPVVSNQPPPAGIQAKQSRQGSGTSAGDIPEALREPLQRFPVTLYGHSKCADPCDNGRRLLQARGVPYTEKWTDAPEVLEELKKLGAGESIPTLLVGRQTTLGFEVGAWNSVLDLAGYPQKPFAGYQAPAKPTPPATAAATPAR